MRKLCSDHENLDEGLKVLNVGFGLGIVSLFPLDDRRNGLVSDIKNITT